MNDKIKSLAERIIAECEKKKFTNADFENLLGRLGNSLYLSKEKANHESLFRVVDSFEDIL